MSIDLAVFQLPAYLFAVLCDRNEHSNPYFVIVLILKSEVIKKVRYVFTLCKIPPPKSVLSNKCFWLPASTELAKIIVCDLAF